MSKCDINKHHAGARQVAAPQPNEVCLHNLYESQDVVCLDEKLCSPRSLTDSSINLLRLA